MSLRFHQSVGLVGPLGEPLRAPEPKPRVLTARPLSPEEERERRGERTRGLYLGEGSSVPMFLGRVTSAPAPAVVPDEGAREKLRILSAPRWLDQRYRPRNLTPGGRSFLERLDPERVVASGGVSPLPTTPWLDLGDRMGYLQKKYMGLDLVRRGLAVESNGAFWPKALEREAELARMKALDLRRDRSDQHPPMDPDEALIWLAAYREAAWDQMRALHPQQADGVDALLQALIDQSLVEERRVRMGAGDLGTLRLSQRGLAAFKSLPGAEDFLRRGFGPRKTGAGIGEYHEQAVGDAIGFFGQEVQILGGTVRGFTLDAGLRREYLGTSHYPDLRVEFEVEGQGRAHWDIEVMGTGRGYARKSVGAKLTGSTMRAFDPLGRASAGRKRDVRVSR